MTAVSRSAAGDAVPVLMMTGLDDVISINRAYEVGATDFITKPINWVILVERIRFMTRAVRMMQAQRLHIKLVNPAAIRQTEIMKEQQLAISTPLDITLNAVQAFIKSLLESHQGILR